MPNDKTPKELGYETQDVGWPLIVWSLIGVVVLSVVTVILIFGTLRLMNTAPVVGDVPAPVASAEVRPIPDAPLLQELPPVDMAEYKTTALDHLNSYGWVDEGARKAHIPIDRAIDIALEQGFATGIPEPAPAADEASDEEAAAEEATEAEDAP